MSQTKTRDRVVPASIATPSSWRQIRAIDNNGIRGEWYDCPESGCGIYIREMNDEWTVGLYRTETDQILERESFDSASNAASYLGKLAFETHH